MGLLGREVVKLITPGTLIEPLDNEANYLLCLSTGPASTVGLAWIDISTGEFQVQEYRLFVSIISRNNINCVFRFRRLKSIALTKTWSGFAPQRYSYNYTYYLTVCGTSLYPVLGLTR